MASLNTLPNLCLTLLATLAPAAQAQEVASEEDLAKLPAGIKWHTDPIAARRAAIAEKKPLLACSEFEGSRRFEAWKKTILEHRNFGKLVDEFVWLHVGDEILLWAVDRFQPRFGAKARANRRFKARFGVMWEATFLAIDPFEFQEATWLPYEPNAEDEPIEAWLDARRLRLRTGMDPDFERYVEDETLADLLESGQLYRTTEERVAHLLHDSHVVQYAALDALTRAESLPAAREHLLGFLQSDHIALRQRAHDALLSEPAIPDLHLEEFLYERLQYTRKEGPRYRWRILACYHMAKYGDDRSIERLGKMAREPDEVYSNFSVATRALADLAEKEPKWHRRIAAELRKSFPPSEIDPDFVAIASPSVVETVRKSRYNAAKFASDTLVKLTGKTYTFPPVYDAKAVIRFWNK